MSSRIFKEPLFLFFVIGFTLFLIYSFLSRQLNQQDKLITVSNAQVAFLIETFKKTWNREPTESELEAQIDNFIKDEIFFREAVALGLDKSDQAIKRRLRQLMELMLDDASSVYPSEEQLQKFLMDHPDKFREDSIISFRQVYFPIDNKKEAEEQLKRLQHGQSLNLENIGVLSMLPSEYVGESQFSVDRLFGRSFSQSVFQANVDSWEGPIESAYGWHLVYVDDLVPGRIPELAQIWDNVEREWSQEQKEIKKEAQYEKMKDKYDIVFEDE